MVLSSIYSPVVKAVHPGLCGIVADAERRLEKARHGRDVDDISFGTFHHAPERRMRQAADGDDVKPMHPVLGFHIRAVIRTGHAEAGVVDEEFKPGLSRDELFYFAQVGVVPSDRPR